MVYINNHRSNSFILEGFPGIGPTTSARLFEHFGSLKNIFSASVEELVEVGKIDEKKALRFKEILER